jgi:ribosomal protein S15P/S13E
MIQREVATMDKETRAALTARVVKLQNHTINWTQDHVTITGFFNTVAEFEKHISYLEGRIAKEDA